MKKYLLFLTFVPFFVLAFDTVAECDNVIDSLTSERFRLRSLPVVVYRDRDDPKSNMSKRLRVVSINRVFSPYDRNCNFAEWSALKKQADQYLAALVRIEEIEKDLEAVKKERLLLLKNTRRRAEVKKL